MRRATFGFCFALVLTATVPAHAQATLPPGEGRDMLAVACSQCHALNVIMSVREGPAGWRRHVTNMVMRGAQLTPREADTVIGYLAANFGPGGVPAAGASPAAGNSPAAKAAPVVLPDGDGKDLVAARCTACHDLERVATIKRQKADWPALVSNMVGRGAAATPAEAQTIASYLAAQFGSD
jgi:cytochrome c5